MVRSIAFASLVFCLFYGRVAAATTYYVAPDGDDSKSGSEPNAAWKTLGKANAAAGPGDVVELAAGTYHERIQPEKSGTAGAEIVYRGKAGEEVVVDGLADSLEVVSLWVDHIRLENLTIKSQAHLQILNHVEYWVHLEGDYLTLSNVRVIADGDVAHNYWELGAQSRGVVAAGKHVTIEDSLVRGVAMGIVVAGGSPRFFTLRRTTVKDTGSNNVDIGSPDDGSSELQGNLIEDCVLDGSIEEDNIQFEPNYQDHSLPYNRGTVIRRSRLGNAAENAIDFKGAAFVLVEGNVIHGAVGDNDGAKDGNDKQGGAGFELGAGDVTRHVIARGNVFYDCNTGAHMYQGYHYYNNAFLNNRRDFRGPNQTDGDFAGLMTWNMPNEDRAFLNNIVAAQPNQGVFYFQMDGGDRFALDYNLYWDFGQAPRFHHRMNGEMVTAVGLSDWQSALSTHGGYAYMHGKDGHSVEAEPGFVNVPQYPVGFEESWDFHLAPGSAAIDAGGALTQAEGNANAGSELVVADPYFFSAGFAATEGDRIRIGTGPAVVVSDVDYEAKKLSLAEPRTWSDGDPVFFDYSGSAPDIGPNELLAQSGAAGSGSGAGSGTGGAGPGSGGAWSSGGVSSGGAAGSAAPPSARSDDGGDASGCGCRIPRSSRGGFGWLATALAVFAFRRKKLVAAMAALLFPAPALAQPSGLSRVWAVNDSEKVRADDLSHWAASSPDNAVWDGTTVELFSARNEVVAFQLILEAGSDGAKSVNVSLPSLASGGNVLKNTSQDPFDFVGRRIELFTEHYIHVTERTTFGGSWGWVPPAPDSDFLGLVPDALIPFEAPPGPHAHGIGGAPFAIAPSLNQGVWVDIYVPKGQAAGDYAGTLSVEENGAVTRQIPVKLHVYDFTLPDDTHFHNMFFFGASLIERHGVENSSPAYFDLFRKYMNLAHRHRMDLSDGARKPDEFAEHLGGYYTGEYYDAAHGYDGPGAGVGNRTYSIGTYDQPEGGWNSGFYPATKEAWQAAADAWETWFSAHAPDVVRFKYMTDEPQPKDYDAVIERAGWIHSSSGPGKNLKTYCTVRIEPTLYGAIDFWSLTVQSGYDDGSGITAGYDLPKVKERQALGELAAIYNGTRPSYGQASALDAPAADNRVNPWIAWKYGVDQYFMWETGGFTYYPHNPWDDQYIGDGGGKAWGNGDYIYPGTDVKLLDDSRGLDGPIASLRMKNWRRGQQDYEYLWLAHEHGIDTQAIVDDVVPAAFNDYQGSFTSQGQQPVWAERGHVYEAARKKLALLLDGKAGAGGGTGGSGGSLGSGGGAGSGGVAGASGGSGGEGGNAASGASSDGGCSLVPVRASAWPLSTLGVVALFARRRRRARHSTLSV